MTSPGWGIIAKIEKTAIKVLKRHGDRFGFVLLVTDTQPHDDIPKGTLHLSSGGYGAGPKSTEIILRVLKGAVHKIESGEDPII